MGQPTRELARRAAGICSRRDRHAGPCNGTPRPECCSIVQSVKDSNPKDRIGISKTPYSTVPSQVVAEVGLAMLEGACKYGRHNYRAIGVRASVYYDACMRHLTLWWEGQDIDPDSGLPHIVKAIAGLTVLRDAQINGKWHDDRPPAVADQNWMVEWNKKAAEILARYPDPKEPFTQLRMIAESRGGGVDRDPPSDPGNAGGQL